jgi:hypothetical protein
MLVEAYYILMGRKYGMGLIRGEDMFHVAFQKQLSS